ncbi:MAG: hypothetical protein HEEMFOPI_01269 [Holosporales bacterium]
MLSSVRDLFESVVINTSVIASQLTPHTPPQIHLSPSQTSLVYSSKHQDCDLSPLQGVKKIENEFLNGCVLLKHIDFLELAYVVHIGSFFLAGCKGVTKLDFSPLRFLEKIEHSFLLNCVNLTELILPDLTQMNQISDYFLKQCSSLKTLDFKECPNVTQIGNGFLFCCTKLTDLNLSGFKGVTTIGNTFLFNCALLPSIDLKTFTDLKKIGSCFLNITGLETLDLSALEKIEEIDSYFMNYCTKLKKLILPTFCHLTFVGDSFLKDTQHFEDIVLDSILQKKIIETVSSQTHLSEKIWLKLHLSYSDSLFHLPAAIKHTAGVSAQSQFHLQLGSDILLFNFTRVTEVGPNFLANAFIISTLDLAPLENLKKIDDGFLKDCKGLMHLEL